MYSVKHTDTSTRCFEALGPEQRQQVIRLIAKLQLAPWVDNISKFTLYELGSMVTICHDERDGWAVYHMDGDTIVIWGLGIGGPYVEYDT